MHGEIRPRFEVESVIRPPPQASIIDGNQLEGERYADALVEAGLEERRVREQLESDRRGVESVKMEISRCMATLQDLERADETAELRQLVGKKEASRESSSRIKIIWHIYLHEGKSLISWAEVALSISQLIGISEEDLNNKSSSTPLITTITPVLLSG